VLGSEQGQELEIPAGTQPGEVLKLHNFGMPLLQTNRKGDLYVKVNVKVPKKLNQHQRELLQEFAKSTESSSKRKSAKGFWDKLKKV